MILGHVLITYSFFSAEDGVCWCSPCVDALLGFMQHIIYDVSVDNPETWLLSIHHQHLNGRLTGKNVASVNRTQKKRSNHLQNLNKQNRMAVQYHHHILLF